MAEGDRDAPDTHGDPHGREEPPESVVDVPAPRRSWLAQRLLQHRTAILAYALWASVGALGYTAAATVELPYVIERPGPVFDVQEKIEPAPSQKHGAIYMTTVITATGRLVSILPAMVDPRADVVPRTTLRPANMSPEQYARLTTRMMDESKIAAQVVGLRAAGYEVQVEGQGAEVQEIQVGSRATGLLMPGDVIVGAGGDPVKASADVIAVVRRFRPGDLLPLVIMRDGVRREVSIPLGASSDDPARPRVGVVILTHILDVKFPVDVKITTSDVSGSSAGLAFALGVYQAASGTDLTVGHKVAMSGSLTPDGKVDPVAGVKFKVWAAEDAGAELFIAPEANRAEAEATAKRLRVVGVATFDDALQAIRAFTRR
jgi:PDZ domain-containing protein